MDNYQLTTTALAGCDTIAAKRSTTTVAQNIDDRIAQAREQIARLERVKELLAEPGGILNVPIEDLRYAMVY